MLPATTKYLRRTAKDALESIGLVVTSDVHQPAIPIGSDCPIISNMK